MKLSKLIESKESLQTVIKCPLPVSIAWDLKKSVKALDEELKIFEELKNAKIVEFGEKTLNEEQQEVFKVKSTNLEQFSKYMTELLEKEIEISFPTIKFEDIKNCKDVNGEPIQLSTRDLLVLDWLIIRILSFPDRECHRCYGKLCY